MGIGEQFVGIDMKELIGSPLSATAEASIFLAHSTADFINKVGIDENGVTRSVNFRYERTEPDIDGSINTQQMKVDIPMLSIIPIPNLQIDEVSLLFDMEVKQYSRSDSGRSFSSGLSGGAGFGPANISVRGSVATHSANTRGSDNSAKYQVSISASNHGIPEGMARVLDIMAANISPALLASRAVDELGNELDEPKKIKNQNLRKLRERQLRLDSAVRASKEIFDTRLRLLSERLEAIHSAEHLVAVRLAGGNAVDVESLDTAWNSLHIAVRGIVLLAADTLSGEDEKDYSLEDYHDIPWAAPFDGEAKQGAALQIKKLFMGAVSAWRIYSNAVLDSDENRIEYNELIIL